MEQDRDHVATLAWVLQTPWRPACHDHSITLPLHKQSGLCARKDATIWDNLVAGAHASCGNLVIRLSRAGSMPRASGACTGRCWWSRGPCPWPRTSGPRR